VFGYKTYEAYIFIGSKEIGEVLVDRGLAQYVREKGEKMLHMKKLISNRYKANIKLDLSEDEDMPEDFKSECDSNFLHKDVRGTGLPAGFSDDDDDIDGFDVVGFDDSDMMEALKHFGFNPSVLSDMKKASASDKSKIFTFTLFIFSNFHFLVRMPLHLYL